MNIWKVKVLLTLCNLTIEMRAMITKRMKPEKQKMETILILMFPMKLVLMVVMLMTVVLTVMILQRKKIIFTPHHLSSGFSGRELDAANK